MDQPFEVFSDIKTGETFVRWEICLHSPDGKTFYELKDVSFGGTNRNYEMVVLDPHSGDEVRVDVKRRDSVIDYDGRLLHLLSDGVAVFYSREPVVPLPTVRVPQYLFQNPLDESLIYVSADKYKFSYESFKMFIGCVGNGASSLQQVHVERVDRYRDGGTTYIHTKSGVLFSPTSLGGEKKPSTWNNATLVRLKPEDYAITETNDGVVQITRKG